jgi:hypothetical protein
MEKKKKKAILKRKEKRLKILFNGLHVVNVPVPAQPETKEPVMPTGSTPLDPTPHPS